MSSSLNVQCGFLKKKKISVNFLLLTFDEKNWKIDFCDKSSGLGPQLLSESASIC